MPPITHAKLSASGASRWINCPPSVKLEEGIPRKSSTFADEGSAAHSLGELELQKVFGLICDDVYDNELIKFKDSSLGRKYYNTEMQQYAEDYAQYIFDQCNGVAGNLAIEQLVKFDRWVPDGFGTSDANWVDGSVLKIFDFKYGQGVPVYAKDNAQGMLYALGVYSEFEFVYDFNRDTRVEIHIYQPRIGNISHWCTTVGHLLDWANGVVAEAAKLALAGEGKQKAGSHCKFCGVKHKCKALAEYNLQLAKYDFAEPATLTKHEIVDILSRKSTFIEWINSVETHAFEQALSGEKFPGYKIVLGRSSRVWVDEEKVKAEFEGLGYTEDEYTTSKLIGIGAAEKLLGKKELLPDGVLGKYVTKPEGKPTFVNDNDNRPEFIPSEQAKKDFKKC